MSIILLKIFLKKEKVKYKENYSFRCYSSCKVGVDCSLYIMPNSQEQVIELIRFLKTKKMKYNIVGETSNLVFVDGVTYGVVITTKLLDKVTKRWSPIFAHDFK
ncbi:hypothetical protein M9194_07730 [Vibrio sp. S4M6]|uniref:hypothetical protein n=1 Tax=Vibrio sinus TaxID=2946865 RepID=UPI002029E9BE|nr:hypothetical protein [Vibrio sinus]MCL9781316.1 hypothetical protein [Vibrio sinus]